MKKWWLEILMVFLMVLGMFLASKYEVDWVIPITISIPLVWYIIRTSQFDSGKHKHTKTPEEYYGIDIPKPNEKLMAKYGAMGGIMAGCDPYKKKDAPIEFLRKHPATYDECYKSVKSIRGNIIWTGKGGKFIPDKDGKYLKEQFGECIAYSKFIPELDQELSGDISPQSVILNKMDEIYEHTIASEDLLNLLRRHVDKDAHFEIIEDDYCIDFERKKIERNNVLNNVPKSIFEDNGIPHPYPSNL
jgi:hypothetical protein